MKLLHNPRCSKSRQSLELLQKSNVEPEIVKYLDNPPTVDELASIIEMLGIKPEELLRKNESIFKENYKGKEFSDKEWIEIMVNNPKLIERPIFINKGKAIVGRPPEQVLTLL